MARTWTVRRQRSAIAQAVPAAAPALEYVWRCPECDEPWLPGDGWRWKAYPTDEPAVTVFCPDCAEREFGDD